MFSKLCINSGTKNGERKRFCYIIISTEFKTAYNIKISIICGKQDNRNIRKIGFYFNQKIKSAAIRKCNVKQYE